MPLFKKSFNSAWADAGQAREAEFQRVMALPSAPELAADLMRAFGPDGVKGGEPLTQHDVINWLFDQHEFPSKGMRAMSYRKLGAPVREALQILEHAELVYATIETERPDNWRATAAGLAALAAGEDVVRRRISERSGASSVSAEVVPPERTIGERLQELETLRSTGALSETEYLSKRERIIDEL